jgi:hypothetical protein
MGFLVFGVRWFSGPGILGKKVNMLGGLRRV